MIAVETIAEIISVYAKHGWSLRRVLLSPVLKAALTGHEAELFGNAEIRDHEVDAAWFSRERADGETAWEIRHLSDTAYALVAVLDAETEDLDTTLAATETRLIEAVTSRTSGH